MFSPEKRAIYLLNISLFRNIRVTLLTSFAPLTKSIHLISPWSEKTAWRSSRQVWSSKSPKNFSRHPCFSVRYFFWIQKEERTCKVLIYIPDDLLDFSQRKALRSFQSLINKEVSSQEIHPRNHLVPITLTWPTQSGRECYVADPFCYKNFDWGESRKTAFSAVFPTLWNTLLSVVKLAPTISAFGKDLKTWLCQTAQGSKSGPQPCGWLVPCEGSRRFLTRLFNFTFSHHF